MIKAGSNTIGNAIIDSSVIVKAYYRGYLVYYNQPEQYIVFADPVVEQICATNWGDGVGLKPSQASRVTSIGTTFRNNTTITSFDELVYFTGLTSLAAYCFAGCTSLESVSLPSSVISWGGAIFDGDSALTTLTLNSVISASGNYMFRGTSSLYRINVPSLRDWMLCVFSGNAGHYPGFASKIHLYSEETGSEITSVTIPSDIVSIRERCFFNCEGIGGNLVIPNTVTSIGGDFIAETSISSVTIPGSVTSLPDQLFSVSCPSLRTIIIEEGVETIGTYFLNSTNGWTFIDLPSTLTSIGQSAFGRSGANPVIVCRATTPPTLGVNPWKGTNSGLKIYVPYSANHSILDTYKAETNWNTMASKMYELNPDGTIPT